MSCTPHAEATRAENRATTTTTFRQERDVLRPPPYSNTPRPNNTAKPESRACGTGGLRSFHLPTLLTAAVARVVRAWAQIGRWRHLPSMQARAAFLHPRIYREAASKAHATTPDFPRPHESDEKAPPRRFSPNAINLSSRHCGGRRRAPRWLWRDSGGEGAWGILYGGGDRVTPGPPPTGLFPPLDGSRLVWDNAIVERERRTCRASPLMEARDLLRKRTQERRGSNHGRE